MSIFFFLVGLEIKREFAEGEFKNPKNAALPVIAAIGGMAIPALIFVLFNTGQSSVKAWAVAMPTEYAQFSTSSGNLDRLAFLRGRWQRFPLLLAKGVPGA